MEYWTNDTRADVGWTLVGHIRKGGSDRIYFGVIATGEAWRYHTCHDMIFRVDGKPFSLGPERYHGTSAAPEEALVNEFITFDMTRTQLRAWAKAQKIEYKICNDEGTFPDEFMQDIRAYGPAWEEAVSKKNAS